MKGVLSAGAFHLRRTRTFLAFADFELHSFTFLKFGSLDFRMVNEKIFTVFLLDESKSFFRTEPLNFSC